MKMYNLSAVAEHCTRSQEQPRVVIRYSLGLEGTAGLQSRSGRHSWSAFLEDGWKQDMFSYHHWNKLSKLLFTSDLSLHI